MAVPLNTLALKFPLLSLAAIVLAVFVVFAVLYAEAGLSAASLSILIRSALSATPMN